MLDVQEKKYGKRKSLLEKGDNGTVVNLKGKYCAFYLIKYFHVILGHPMIAVDDIS